MDEEVKIEGGLDIQKALKEFEVKSKAEETQNVPKALQTPDAPKMVGLVMKWFRVKEQKTAEYILLGVVVLMFVASFYLFFGSEAITKTKIEPPAGYKMIYPQDGPPIMELTS